MDKLRYYVDIFNADDEEIYKNYIDNAHAYEWLKNEIPLFECPDEDVERAYYFRWWTFRKHVKSTAEGFVVTEFLPDVPWSGRYNVINAPNGHHMYEGRWLKNADTYLTQYADVYFNDSENAHKYSTWFIDGLWALYSVVGKLDIDSVLSKACAYYEKWEDTHLTDIGAFWSIDDRDAMECSISGTTEDGRAIRGIRPTLNSYMCGDALAIARLALLANRKDIADKYLNKHENLKAFINGKLWCDGFYRAFHYENNEYATAFDTPRYKSIREEIGYIPWMFNIPPKGREDVFSLLNDENCFYTPYGIASADKSHKRFLYEKNHECLWNGYVWPYATSQTLTALKNVIKNYGRTDFEDTYSRLLVQYAKSHNRITESGKKVCWIDEVRHPLRDEWSSRQLLKEWGWREDKGGYERGKDYNHSTFCDLIISGLVGVNTENETLTVTPTVPEEWNWFKLSNLSYRGSTYTVIYDRDGSKYGGAKGISIIKEK